MSLQLDGGCPSAQANFASSFSYVIVGGGTAGLTVAARLSEDKANTVLVLEAGIEHLDDPLVNVPAEVGAVYGNPDYDWLYKTAPQSGANGNVFNFTRGKILGGTSALNAMLWDRSSKPEYNLISQLGNPGWDWDGLIPYFKKAENFTKPDPAFAETWNLTFDLSTRGLSGPIKTAFTSFIPQAEAYIQPGAIEVGLDRINEPLAGLIAGTWRAESSVDPVTRTRSYSATAYYVPNKGRPNLTVLTGAQVSKINWSKSGGKTVTATGVSFTMAGKNFSVQASREVILAASSVGSPQLLELSGIGNKTLLNKLGIESVVDLPTVGENMQEHTYVILSYRLKPDVGTLDQLFSNTTFLSEQEKLFSTSYSSARPASGGLTYTASGVSMLGLPHLFNSTDAIFASLTSELLHVPRTSGQRQQQALQFNWLHNINSSVVEVLTEGLDLTPEPGELPTGHASFLILLQQPFSRGSTHIASKNFLDHPVINPKYFEAIISSAAQFVRNKLVKTPAWSSVVVSESFPGAEVQTSAQWTSFIKSTLNSQGHTVGTCSMQPQEEGGVVDPTLKVYGTSNVRVVDLSVMPLQFSGHPQALVYAIAEKAADIIKAANK
ncbi:alcohol oxidase [Mycena epipterygia]|nr:alcohol oxidase [Mycena epipterygia]